MNKYITELRNNGYYIGIIDGSESKNFETFLSQIAVAFKFPNYYGNNLNAFRECINDLNWIIDKNYCLVITNFTLFMSDETTDNKEYLLNVLKEVTHEWSNVPNYEGEAEFRNKADFKVVLNK